MPWSRKQNAMWHARAKRGDRTAKRVLRKKDYRVKKNTPAPRTRKRRGH
jgi:hypothetical protein